MAHRTNAVWGGKSVGWVSKKDEQDAQYEVMGDGWPLFIAFCRFWPDYFADILWSDEAEFKLTFIQRMILRINARYRDVDITGCRGVTKSFCTDMGEYIDAILWPGIITGIYGPSALQSAGIARKIWAQLERNMPMLTEMLIVARNGTDVFAVKTPYGSEVSIEAFRGNSMHRVVAEESAQEDKKGVFNAVEFSESVIPQVRLNYQLRGQESPAYIAFKQHSITSAGRRQQYAFESRSRHRRKMINGDSAYIIDIPVDVVALCQIRTVEWVEKQKEEIGLSGVPRELESIATGNERNPLIPDDVLSASRCLAMPEQHHCCMDRDNKLKPEDVIYVLGFDIAYRDNKRNAKCAVVVVKLTKQDDYYRRDKYLKRVVWVQDWTPADTPTPIMNAQKVRGIFNRFCYDGSQTYLAIDAWQVGNDVMTALMADQGDGLRPLCTVNHMEYTELELEGAIPVIYPIRAGGVGTRDPDGDMIFYAQKQFMYGNVQLLTSNLNEGVEAYKKTHRIKDDSLNYQISLPFKRTNELVGQIQNLREEPSGQGIREKRISQHIQRDSWSALKYALRFAQILERANLQQKKQENEWTKLFRKNKTYQEQIAPQGGRTAISRRRGRLF